MSARSLYLELSALGIDVQSGAVPALRGLTCADVAALMRRVRENREELREVLADMRDQDLEAVRQEGGAT